MVDCLLGILSSFPHVIYGVADHAKVIFDEPPSPSSGEDCVPAAGSEARIARKPYSKPTCTLSTNSGLIDQFQAVQNLRLSLNRRGGPVLTVESYSGRLRSLVDAVDEAFHSAPLPVIILLNVREPQQQSSSASDPHLNVWRISGDPEARDIAAVLATLCSAQPKNQPAPAPLVLRGGTNE